MRHSFRSIASEQPDVVVLAASTWLVSGLVLLGLTPLPLHTASFGWTPAFWLLLAPALLLAARRLFRAHVPVHAADSAPPARRHPARWRVYRRTVAPVVRTRGFRHAGASAAPGQR